MDTHGALGNTGGHRERGGDDLLRGGRVDHRPVDRCGRRGGAGGRASAAGIPRDSEIEGGRSNVEGYGQDRIPVNLSRKGFRTSSVLLRAENQIRVEILRLAVLDVRTEMPFLEGGIGREENQVREAVSIPNPGQLSGLVD